MYRGCFIRILFPICTPCQVNFDLLKEFPRSLISDFLLMNPLPSKLQFNWGTRRLSVIPVKRVTVYGISVLYLNFFKAYRRVFCKVFHLLFSFVHHFFHRNPLLNKLQMGSS